MYYTIYIGNESQREESSCVIMISQLIYRNLLSNELAIDNARFIYNLNRAYFVHMYNERFLVSTLDTDTIFAQCGQCT